MLEVEIRHAFEGGDPQAAWILVQQLVKVAQEAVDEAGAARFQANLGTDVCRHCTGLQAGPGVAATCFQLQRCYFSHLRDDGLDPRQVLVARLLSGG